MIRQAYPRPNNYVSEAIERVLASGQFVKGPEVQKLEETFKQISGCEYNIAVNSGTSALNLIFIALNYPKNSEIIVPVSTFLASANSIETSNYTSKFVDVEPNTLNIDPNKLKEAITENTTAILVVHLYGVPANMDKITKIASEHGLDVIEDACQAHGAIYNDKKIGSIGKVSAFSLFPTKNLSVLGDGGMISTNDEQLARTISMLRNAGRDNSPDDAEMFGYNMRLSEILAAIGNSLLKDFWNDTKRRQQIAEMYTDALSKVDQLLLPKIPPLSTPVWHQYTIQTRNRDALKEYLSKRGIQTSVKYSIPLHLVKVFQEKYKHSEGSFPIGEQAAKSLLCLPMHPFLSNEQVDKVINEIKNFFK